MHHMQSLDATLVVHFLSFRLSWTKLNSHHHCFSCVSLEARNSLHSQTNEGQDVANAPTCETIPQHIHTNIPINMQFENGLAKSRRAWLGGLERPSAFIHKMAVFLGVSWYYPSSIQQQLQKHPNVLPLCRQYLPIIFWTSIQFSSQCFLFGKNLLRESVSELHIGFLSNFCCSM